MSEDREQVRCRVCKRVWVPKGTQEENYYNSTNDSNENGLCYGCFEKGNERHLVKTLVKRPVKPCTPTYSE